MTLGLKTGKPLLLAAVLAAASGAAAQEPDKTGVTIELSDAEPVGQACKMSFVVQNGHKADIGKAVYETVLFDDQGQVARLTLLDFQDLPAGRLRVRQFQFPHTCAGISRVLINGADTCTGDGLPDGACSRGLVLSSKVMELAG
ncbi:hypothetical protein [Phaeobacter gallaeciensis]|uniref:Tat pathway signal protein n=1 Tax=Phaeobacter gallaeciensis TaxID=60890 RepID=A0AAC9ZCA5_9RHOB|nr:hypothetical protein [Phaeobacter gallaeciensis]AHD11163.1 hypothetical protein Gal_03444 [Phaeobacter gallaeciensis DSM 26640]ATE94426.1 hypothetical protein PhaeoP11_03431 [Phaeobacter gallaeciensis]ATE98699.1 hypothetical protein PhaeoP73_03429 [Phaeobacter gallaeciensis]ATF03090.1 hypothetical protein PhaeoP75_03480 [Phaeobacter gallaeciensis]ATF07470.1 hypothetical protein PhaeoP63_03429 [Phaeobacter gallaeciensis]